MQVAIVVVEVVDWVNFIALARVTFALGIPTQQHAENNGNFTVTLPCMHAAVFFRAGVIL